MEKNSEYVYLIRVIDENRNDVYKIGKTKRNIYERLSEYKFKSVLFVSECNNCSKLENEIILALKNKYKLHSGNEYFSCDDENDLKDIVFRVCLNYNKDKIDNSLMNNEVLDILKDNIEIKVRKEIENEYNEKFNKMQNTIFKLYNHLNKHCNLEVMKNSLNNAILILQNNLNNDDNDYNNEYINKLNKIIKSLTENNKILNERNLYLENQLKNKDDF